MRFFLDVLFKLCFPEPLLPNVCVLLVSWGGGHGKRCLVQRSSSCNALCCGACVSSESLIAKLGQKVRINIHDWVQSADLKFWI